MSNEITLIDRLKHFKEAQEKLGDRYGSEVLHYAIEEIEQLEKDKAEWIKVTSQMEGTINELEAGEDWYKNRHEEQQSTIKNLATKLNEASENLSRYKDFKYWAIVGDLINKYRELAKPHLKD